jgi:hypothetical protein
VGRYERSEKPGCPAAIAGAAANGSPPRNAAWWSTPRLDGKLPQGEIVALTTRVNIGSGESTDARAKTTLTREPSSVAGTSDGRLPCSDGEGSEVIGSPDRASPAQLGDEPPAPLVVELDVVAAAELLTPPAPPAPADATLEAASPRGDRPQDAAIATRTPIETTVRMEKRMKRMLALWQRRHELLIHEARFIER